MNQSKSFTLPVAKIEVNVSTGLDQEHRANFEQISTFQPLFSGGPCPHSWDGVFCRAPTTIGSLISQPCSDVRKPALSEQGDVFIDNGDGICQVNENWLWGNLTDFDNCFQSYINSVVQNLLFFGSLLSFLCLTLSISIYYYFKCLRCDRVTIIVNLMLALALRSLSFVVITGPLVLGIASYRENGIACKIVISVYLFATMSSVSWMLIQGIFLHSKLTSNVFNVNVPGQFFAYYVVGWGFPAVLMVSYVAVLSTAPVQEPCWRGHSEMQEVWIIMGPIMFALIMNGLFLIRILGIVVQNTRQGEDRIHNNIHQILTIAKATLLLSPILGVNNLLVLYNPGGDYEKYYVLLNAVFGATQGIIISVAYCFVCKDVHGAVRRMYKRFKSHREIHAEIP